MWYKQHLGYYTIGRSSKKGRHQRNRERARSCRVSVLQLFLRTFFIYFFFLHLQIFKSNTTSDRLNHTVLANQKLCYFQIYETLEIERMFLGRYFFKFIKFRKDKECS